MPSWWPEWVGGRQRADPAWGWWWKGRLPEGAEMLKMSWAFASMLSLCFWFRQLCWVYIVYWLKYEELCVWNMHDWMI
jgi:hypothetical protein